MKDEFGFDVIEDDDQELVVDDKPEKPYKRVPVPNSELLAALIEAKQKGEFTPRLAVLIKRLIENFSRHRQFIRYTYREDMVAAALLNCSKFWHRFDETKSQNPFAYFTQVAKNSFYSYLNTEREQNAITDELRFMYAGMQSSGNARAMINDDQ